MTLHLVRFNHKNRDLYLIGLMRICHIKFTIKSIRLPIIKSIYFSGKVKKSPRSSLGYLMKKINLMDDLKRVNDMKDWRQDNLT